MARVKGLIVNLFLLFLTFLVFGVVLEVVLAVVQINQKSNTQFVQNKGPVYVPGAYYRHTKEGFSQGYFNSHGFRDYERMWEKPEDTLRILVLGDSYVEAFQVAHEDSFPALLQKKLNVGFLPKRVEVIALGQSGFGTAQSYMRYVNSGRLYSPDLVILAFLTGNDFKDNSKFLSRDGLRFYFEFDDRERLVLDNSLYEEYERGMGLVRSLFQSLKQHSYLLSLVSERVYLLSRELQKSRFDGQLTDVLQEEEKGRLDEFSHLNIYRSDLSKSWREAVAVTKSLILKFKNTVEEDGARFVLVSLSNAEQVHPRIREQVNEKYAVTFDYDQPDRMLEEYTKQQGITYLKLMPVFREAHLRTGKDLHGFGSSGRGHWNENGHRLAAAEILKFLKYSKFISIN